MQNRAKLLIIENKRLTHEKPAAILLFNVNDQNADTRHECEFVNYKRCKNRVQYIYKYKSGLNINKNQFSLQLTPSKGVDVLMVLHINRIDEQLTECNTNI